MLETAELAYTFILFGWVLFITLFATKQLYRWMRSRGLEHHVAVYYNRKIIHILAGGVVAVFVPFLFKNYTPIAVLVAVLAVGNYLPHRRKRLLYWYQVEENMYEVNFTVMWGLVMGVGFLLNNVMLGVVPILFMSVGDGVTGLVRNAIYGRRTKSWWGNLAMALFCIPAGFLLYGVVGALSGAAASVVERFELGVVDDNVTVPLTSFALMTALPHVLVV
ncbi:MAG: dolichol kinase [Candidatus Caldarchaeum sp.]|nr:dolichol kinase [Candidatus Caldarchaeum sp.]